MAAPSGTVTFLFTDIEGSTGLWEAAPEAMRSALERHDAILRGAVDDFGGHVFATGGDGFAVAFARAADALSAAAAAQRALLAERWPTPSLLKVRMGVHTGEASERDGDYFGPVLNRAARLMAAGSGGQVLVSATTAGVVGVAELVDLGVHRLRDLAEAQQVFQLGDGTFPPLRTLDAFRTNLVPELSSFVGRDTELRAVTERLRAARVVSIVGVGGVGKTRLAVHVASELLPRYADGVWLCELAPVSEQGSIPDAVAAAVGYAPPQGVSVADGLPRFLERKELLLVIDNCEHLVDAAAAFVSSTTAAATRVSVLATSREALGVRGEQIFPLPSLGLPMSADAVSVLASEAGALFVARAGEAGSAPDLDGPTATAVYDLCVRLDGIPLAIELAAARTAMMTPAEIVARLDRQFQLLTGGRRTRLERHQTLRAAIDWSYDLLDHDERGLL
ncbi:MAG TPA: adenylate/guanylate cyclase domain-containing protein, partial [Gaiellales bacterium]|nr:adenylate/guanylate cyclase domain-containing protein [Gaiellales bacterium]